MKTITAIFKCGSRAARATPLWQYDYGQVLAFDGIDLPSAYEVHFSTELYGESVTQIGDETGVVIPDEYLLTGKTIYAWIYLHTEEDDGETVYTIEIPVRKRSTITEQQPTPVQQDTITQAIAALQIAVDRTDASAEEASISAQSAAESAQEATQSASDASESESQANTHAEAAAVSERNSAASEANASTSAQNAAQSESRAEAYADRAEQGAGTAGWMYFEIVNGELIMERTPNSPMNFYLEDGNLMLEAIA